MDLKIEDKRYLLNSKIKLLEGKINLIEVGEHPAEELEDLQAQIQVLTNILEML